MTQRVDQPQFAATCARSSSSSSSSASHWRPLSESRSAAGGKTSRLVREHWGIQNRIFHVCDVTLGEDASRVRRGTAPQILAALRNLTLGVMERAKWTNKAQAARHYAAKPLQALRLLNPAKN